MTFTRSISLLFLVVVEWAVAQYDPLGSPGLNVHISPNVTAGVSTVVTLDSNAIPVDLRNNNVNTFRVRLYNSVANYPICTLLSITPEEPTSVNITVPADVGPAGAYYAVALDYVESASSDAFFNTYIQQSGRLSAAVFDDKFSNAFYLLNATSAWIPYEMQDIQDTDGHGGRLIYELNSTIPCVSYECVRKCAQLYPTPTGSLGEQPTATYDAAYLKCAGNCAGVRLPPNPQTTGDPNAPPNSMLSPPTINSTCSEGRHQTPCNQQCCNEGQVCLWWDGCVDRQSQSAAESSVIGSVLPLPTMAGASSLSLGPIMPSSTGSAGSASSGSTSGASRLNGDQPVSWQSLVTLPSLIAVVLLSLL